MITRTSGADPPDLEQDLFAVGVGHGEIEQHRVDLVAALPEGLDRSPAAARGDDPVTGPFQEGLRHFDDVVLVVHDQDGAAASLRDARLQRALETREVAVQFRQQHAHRVPRPDPASDLHHAAMRPHDSEHRRQPETPARELGGEERLEDARLRGRVHALAVVGDLEKGIGARAGRSVPAAPAQVLCALLDDPRADAQ